MQRRQQRCRSRSRRWHNSQKVGNVAAVVVIVAAAAVAVATGGVHTSDWQFAYFRHT